jgi:hypothetical protein
MKRRGHARKKKVSCLDVVRDLVGHFEGPPDLSTNKEHLMEAMLADSKPPRKKRS